MSTPCICGVDPGASGGIAFINANTGALLAAYAMPRNKDGSVSGELLAAMVTGHKPVRAYVEQVSSRPRQQGQFKFGISTGVVHGVLGATGVPFALVSPVSWKFAYGLKREEEETKRSVKRRAVVLAQQMFASMADKLTKDGLAEAALIGLYGLNLFISE